MSTTFENLQIQKIIVHETGVMGEDTSPRFSASLTPIDPEGINLLQVRISEALGSESHCVEMSIAQFDVGSTFDICTQLLDANDTLFVELSQRLTKRLTDAQTVGTRRAGIAVAITGTVGVSDKRFAAILKAETDAEFAKEIGPDGISLMYLHDLILTPQQKLYKIGFFIEEEHEVSPPCVPRSISDFSAIVFDHLMNRNESGNAAQYFYRTFLGCNISPTSKKLTKDFYEKTSEFINALTVDDETKFDLKNSLTAYLKSQRSTISVGDFSRDFMDTQVRKQYIQWAKKTKLPTHDFQKDVILIKTKLRFRRIKFSSGIKIIGPSEDFKSLVEIQGVENGWTTIKVSGSIDEQP